ncbi:MAG: hypothetical protein GVY30_00070 [Chloroflexi bacterium]|jgi:ParB-like chromosome segregation protein Spo0J|nr:hypothetical protein [Chloroflexota bacterium]
MNVAVKFHKVASIFPMMDEDQLAELSADIEKNGLIDAIWTYKGEIVDGRNRYLACQRVGETPRYQEWGGGSHEQLVAFVVALNLKRRHLTSSQRATVALAIEKVLAEEAKERQNKLAGTRPNLNPDLVEEIPQGQKGKSRDQAAEIAGTNPRYVQDAKKIESEAPDLLEKVADGSMSIPKAKKELRKREREAERDVILKIFDDTGMRAAGVAIRVAYPDAQTDRDLPDRYIYQEDEDADQTLALELYRETGSEELGHAIARQWPGTELPAPRKTIWTYTCACGQENEVRAHTLETTSHFCPRCGRMNKKEEL